MSGVEVLAGLGYLASELFKYNRENYEFDQEQRFEREECRLKMQIERFTLFREDIRDLVELTVGKMDLYHLIGALFLKMIVLYYCVGFFTQPVPPFLLCLYYVSNACAWLWLILAIWLAMHASISSHSYGTRLLTRFIRLPIPGSAQINVLNARYADFEKQGLQMMRVPFMKREANAWRQRNARGSLSDDAPQQVGDDGKVLPAKGARSRQNGRGGAAGSATGANGGASESAVAMGAVASGGIGDTDNKDWLGAGEYAYGGAKDIAGREAEMLRAVEFRTHRHVQLFRQLQSQWQCYDAYARVAMSLGVRAMIQSLTYYLMGICLVDQQAPFVAYGLALCLQAMATVLYILDIHGLPCYGNLVLSALGAAPVVLALWQLTNSDRTEDGLLMDDNPYRLAIAAFPLEICWMHLSIWAASPTDRENGLPRHFRSVLFMDVFAEIDDPAESGAGSASGKLDDKERSALEKRAEAADSALFEANAALRRWEAAPSDALSREQKKILKQASKELGHWVHALTHELQLRKVPGLAREQIERKLWEQLSTGEREEDPFAGYVMGPFIQYTGSGVESRYYYDPETREYMYDPIPVDRTIFTLQSAVGVVRDFAHEVEEVCALGGRPTVSKAEGDADDDDGGQGEEEEGEEDAESPLTRARSQGTLTTSAAARVGKRAEDMLRPNRLPWQLIRISGRAIQVVWLFVFVMMVLRVTKVVIIDWQGEPIRDELARRRRLSAVRAPGSSSLLAAAPALPTLPADFAGAGAGATGGLAFVPGGDLDHDLGGAHGAWPCDCPFFRPTRLSCLPVDFLSSEQGHFGLENATGEAEPRTELVVSDAFAVYRTTPRGAASATAPHAFVGPDSASGADGAAVDAVDVDGDVGASEFLEELPQELFPPGASVVCSSSGSGTGRSAAEPQCFVGSLTEAGLSFRPLGRRALRPLRRRSSSAGAGADGEVESGEWAESEGGFFFAFEGEPWSIFAGALVPCASTGAIDEESDTGASASSGSGSVPAVTFEADKEPLCLLIAGLPHRASALQVALLRLPSPPPPPVDAPPRRHDAGGASSKPRPLIVDFELSLDEAALLFGDAPAPLASASSSAPALAVAALSIEPRTGRLVAALGPSAGGDAPAPYARGPALGVARPPAPGAGRPAVGGERSVPGARRPALGAGGGDGSAVMGGGGALAARRGKGGPASTFLAAWSLLDEPGRFLGLWSLRAPAELEVAGGGFLPLGLCHDEASGELLVAGRAPSSALPSLLRTSASPPR